MTTDDGSLLATEAPINEEPPLGFGAKLWNLFVDPRKTFAGIGKNNEWVILWILVSVIAIGTYLPNKSIILQEQLDQIETRLSQDQQMTAEQRQEALDSVEGQIAIAALVTPPIAILAVLFIVAGILLFIGNIILGGTVGFKEMLNAYAWTTMLWIPAGIVMMLLIMAKGSSEVTLGLGVLTTTETGAFVKSLLSSIELFAVWQVWLSAVAVSVLASIEIKKAFWSIAAAWFVWIIVKAGLASLGDVFGS